MAAAESNRRAIKSEVRRILQNAVDILELEILGTPSRFDTEFNTQVLGNANLHGELKLQKLRNTLIYILCLYWSGHTLAHSRHTPQITSFAIPESFEPQKSHESTLLTFKH